MKKMLAAVAAAVVLATPSARAQDLGIPVGTVAPGAPLHTLEGATVDLKSYFGKKPVVIEFWATWCPLCKQLEPAMKAAKERHGADVEFIGITVPQNQTPEKAKQFIETNMMKGVFLFDTDGAAYKAFSSPHTSYVVVVNKAGKVTYTGVGGKQDLEAAIATAK